MRPEEKTYDCHRSLPAAIAPRWQGFDEMDPVCRARDAELDEVGLLTGESRFHDGDDSTLRARDGDAKIYSAAVRAFIFLVSREPSPMLAFGRLQPIYVGRGFSRTESAIVSVPMLVRGRRLTMLRTRREINCLLLSSIHVANEVATGRPTTIGLRFGEGAGSLDNEPTPLGSKKGPFKASTKFFVNPNSGAAKWLRDNANNPDAKYMRIISDNMHSMWLGRWNRRIADATTNMLKQHAAQGAMPVFVVYNIPGRDNGGYSSGGEGSPEAYYEWITAFGSALGDSDAIIILEPDALALSTTISDEQNRAMRYALINTTVDILKKQAKAKVYIDAGHPNWHPAGEMADLLDKGGIRKTDGFFVNASNFVDTAKCIDYGRSISARTGGAHFVIDTSRNGRGAPVDRGEYCNPSGVGLGHLPTVTTGEPLCDALLWIKIPGESDGPCNGGPAAGRFWPEYAIALAKNA